MILSTQIPPTPVAEMPRTAQAVVTTILGVLAVVVVAAALVEFRRTRSPLYPAVLLGGLLAAFNEPIVDILGGCLHHQVGQWTAFTTFDRPMPVWLCLAYLLYFGTAPLVIRRMLDGAAPRAAFQRAIGGLLVANLVLELPILQAGLYDYYGEQPFKIFGFAPHWLVINALGVGFTVVALYRWPALSGRGWPAALVIPAAGQLAAVGAAALPAFSAYNSDVSTAWKWVASAATIVLGVLLIRGLSLLLPAEGPSRAAPSREQSPPTAAAASR
jgi:hypothetical protein